MAEPHATEHDPAPAADDIARARNTHRRTGARLAARIGEVARFVGAAFLIALVIRSFVIQPFIIPSRSMSPLLQPGDFVLVNKAAYGWSLASLPLAGPVATDRELSGWRLAGRAVQPGDVIVFISPEGRDYVKRMIAGGGTRVAMRNGQLVLDGTAVACPPVTADSCRETLPNGASYVVRSNGSGPFSDMAEITVPKGHYFVLGDNRDHSADSRLSRADGGVGLVEDTNVIGRAAFIFFSMNHGVHWNRIGKRLD